MNTTTTNDVETYMGKHRPRTKRSISTVSTIAFLVVSFTVVSVIVPPSRAGAQTTTSIVGSSSNQPNPFRTGRTLVIAHSGGDALFPENTLLAYERSTALGSEVIDIDVQTTADNVLVALHDPTVDRTTNATGSIRKLRWSAVAKLDAGYRFTSGKTFPFRKKGVTIPTIEAVLRRFPNSLVTLDLKDQRPAIAKPVCELITRLNRVKTVYVGSDSNEQVVEFRSICPELRTSGTSDERQLMRAARESGDTTFQTRQLVSQPPFIGSDGRKRVTAETLAFSHALNIAVLTWVVDDPDDMRALIDLEVDGIYTRRPDLLAKLVKERR